MSNLQKLLEKLSGSPEESTEQVEGQTNFTDPVYVEKLAAAVDFIIDQGRDSLEKQANMAKIQENLAKGMSPKEAIKSAYPDMADKDVAALAAKIQASMSGGKGKEAPEKEAPKKEAPEEAEKTSAVDTNVLRSLLSGRAKTASDASADDTTGDKRVLPNNNEVRISAESIRARLREKLASSASNSSVGDFKVIESVMSRLRQLTADSTITPNSAETGTGSTVAPELASADTEAVSAEEVAGAATDDSAKTASTKLTLADMLREATSDNTESTDESAPSESVKTAEDQGISVSSFLRDSIRRKAAQVEV